MIDRATSWRQGSLLKFEEAPCYCDAKGEQSYVVVITHDCDLPQDKESYVELIAAHKVKKEKPFLNAKNVRRLHLKFNDSEGEFFLELCFQSRIIVPKSEFVTNCTGPEESISLEECDKRILKQWLSIRYGRPAYANNFETRLQRRKGKDPVEKLVAALVEKNNEYITGIFFDLDGEKAVELADDVPYNLSIYVVYNAENGAMQARHDAERLAADINSLFIEVYGHPEAATDICIEKCTAIADDRLTLADLMRIDQWRLEWVSLSDENAEFLQVGHA